MKNLEIIQLSNKPDRYTHLTHQIHKLGKILIPKSVYLPLIRRFQRVLAVVRPTSHVHLRRIPPPSSRPDCTQLTIVSANLWHDWPLQRRLNERLESFAQFVDCNNVDIILLQEVSRTPEIKVDEWLAERLRMAYLYSRANGSSEVGFEEGLAIFSRYPIHNPIIKSLGNYPSTFIRRIALGAQITTPSGGLLALSVHLGLLTSRNKSQHADLHEWVNHLPGDFPILIGGDFNAHETSHQIQKIKSAWLDTYRHLHPVGDAPTHELRTPWGSVFRQRRLDYIFLRHHKSHWRILESKHLTTRGKPHSDHRIVLTRLAIPTAI